MSIANPPVCPKCEAHVPPGFDSCPQCGVIFAKLRARESGDVYGGPLPAAGTTQSSKSSAAGTGTEIWKSLGLAALMAVVGFLCFQELDGMEQQGGTVRMNVLVILLYKVAGTTGVAIVFGAATLFFLGSAIRRMASR